MSGKLPIDDYSKYFSDILKGDITLSQNKETKNFEFSIVSRDGRIVKLKYASSGQQSSTPLLMASFAFSFLNYSSKYPIKKILYIEEPEAHLFPKSQKILLDFFTVLFNDEKRVNINLTTHSPYILSYVNNLLKKGMLKNLGKLDKLQSSANLLSIDESNFSSYSLFFNDDKVEISSIFDEELGMIDENAISGVLEEINDEFDEILDPILKDHCKKNYKKHFIVTGKNGLPSMNIEKARLRKMGIELNKLNEIII